MKLIHLSDLHLGKRVNEFSMLEDQQYILNEILDIADEEKPFGVIIAGDIYDKSVPSAEAVQLFDDFLYKLAKRNLKVFIISGNHDSAERIAFAGRLMTVSGVYLSPVYDGKISPLSFDDEYGRVNIYMLPFVKPANVKRFYGDLEIDSYTAALDTVIKDMRVNTSERNVLITHQFVTGASLCDSEELSAGGTDGVSAGVFAPFDYTALGHIHGPQNIGGGSIRYCGTPLKYSFSEAKHKKSVTVAELFEKGSVTVRTVPLTAKRDMRELKGTYETLSSKKFYDGTNTDDYLHITLTDEKEIPYALGKLRVIYSNIMKLDYDNTRTRSGDKMTFSENAEQKTPLELFREFFELQNNKPLDSNQEEYIKNVIEEMSKENQ